MAWLVHTQVGYILTKFENGIMLKMYLMTELSVICPVWTINVVFCQNPNTFPPNGKPCLANQVSRPVFG